jgi:hypothetical protein
MGGLSQVNGMPSADADVPRCHRDIACHAASAAAATTRRHCHRPAAAGSTWPLNLDITLGYQEAEIGELEALVSGVNQISQSTLLLKKKKEMHEVDDSLDFMKGEYKTRMEACDERQREFERRQSEMKEQVRSGCTGVGEKECERQKAANGPPYSAKTQRCNHRLCRRRCRHRRCRHRRRRRLPATTTPLSPTPPRSMASADHIPTTTTTR